MSAPTRRVIACDESGFSGGNLADGEPVFAHASVVLDAASAAGLVAEVHDRLGWSGGELKASRLRHPDRRPTLLWLLGADAGLLGRAAVHRCGTRVFVLTRLLQLLLGPPEGPGAPDGTACPCLDAPTHRAALDLHGLGSATVGPVRWQQLLTAAGDLMWTTSRWAPPDAVDRFFADLDDLRTATRGQPLAGRLAPLAEGRRRAVAARARAAADPSGVPLTAPVLPVVACAVEHWADGVEEMVVLHDEQSALTPSRIRAIEARVHRARPDLAVRVQPGVDSRLDPRIQVADWLAGLARAGAAEAGRARPDPELAVLLEPFALPHDGPRCW